MSTLRGMQSALWTGRGREGDGPGKIPEIRSNRAHLKAPGDRLREEKRAKAECGLWGSLTCLKQETRGNFRKLKIRKSTTHILISWMGNGAV